MYIAKLQITYVVYRLTNSINLITSSIVILCDSTYFKCVHT